MLVFSTLVFFWCGFKEYSTNINRKVEVISLTAMLISLGIMMTDTAVKVATSLG
jgi:hypothetical protein